MAKGCVRYYIQEWVAGEGWTDLVKDFRDTEPNAQKRFEAECARMPGAMLRLGRLFVIDQKVGQPLLQDH